MVLRFELVKFISNIKREKYYNKKPHVQIIQKHDIMSKKKRIKCHNLYMNLITASKNDNLNLIMVCC